ncbi:MAG: hypothetical protein QXS98_05270 [Candidatus Nitrosocaldus sp.]
MNSTTTLIISSSYDNGESKEYTGFNNILINNSIYIPVEPDIDRFIKRYAKYIVANKDKVINFIINNLNTIPVMQAVLKEAEKRLRKGEVKGIEIKLYEDIEDPEDVTLEIVVCMNGKGEYTSRFRLWDELCSIASKVAKEGRIEDVLTKVYVIIKAG